MSFLKIFNLNKNGEESKKRKREEELEEKKNIPIYTGELHNNLAIHGTEKITALREIIYMFQSFFIKNYAGFFELLYSKCNILFQEDITKYYLYVKNISKDITVSINLVSLVKCIKSIDEHYTIIMLLEPSTSSNQLTFVVYKKNKAN